jgi:phosphate transport system substrate-binding protein
VTKCNNPTFTKGDLSKNHLAEIAPQPAACDKVGAGPCTDGTGTAPTTPEAASGGGTAPVAGADGPTGAVDPETGLPVGAATGTGGPGSEAVPTELLAGRTGDTKVFGALAAVELVAIILAPGVGAVYFRRRARRRKLGAW